MNLLRNKLWKFLCIPLLLYSFTAGLYIPLGPGILSVDPASTQRGGTVSIRIHGYNTHFKEDDPSLNVILKNDNNLLCASDVNVVDSTDMIVDYGLPADLYTRNERDLYNLIIYNEQDGRFFLENAFTIERKDSAKGVGLKCATILEKQAAKGTMFPDRSILDETIRNLFFHVPMWFTMMFLMLVSTIASIIYLAKGKEEFDIVASSAAGVGVFFGVLGILTGMLWANFTWGEPWPDDAKLNGVAAGMLIYLAYFVLRGSLNNEQTKARVSAVYSIFAFVIFIVLIKVMPDIQDSLHPGNGGNPAFKKYDLDDTMRPVFYSAALGFIILGCWLLALTARYRNLLKIQLEKE